MCYWGIVNTSSKINKYSLNFTGCLAHPGMASIQQPTTQIGQGLLKTPIFHLHKFDHPAPTPTPPHPHPPKPPPPPPEAHPPTHPKPPPPPTPNPTHLNPQQKYKQTNDKIKKQTKQKTPPPLKIVSSVIMITAIISALRRTENAVSFKLNL